MIRVKHVTQPTRYSCVHACLSMVTGVPVMELIERLGEGGLGSDDEAMILTENGILPICLPDFTPHLMPYVGTYFATVPSINLEGTNHLVVVSLEDDKWVLYDPNEGREGRKSYPRDSFMVAPWKTFGYSRIVFLHEMPNHRGTLERLQRYCDRE